MHLLGCEAALLPGHVVRLPLQLREVHLLVFQGEREAAAENLLYLQDRYNNDRKLYQHAHATHEPRVVYICMCA